MRRRPLLTRLVALAAGALVALSVGTSPAAGTPSSIRGQAPTPTTAPTSATGTAQLSGIVTDDDGAPAGWVVVHASGPRSASTTTDSSGAWTISGLPAGSYAIRFAPTGSSLVGEFWDDAASSMTATYVPLADGAAVTGLDARLARGAIVRGQVTDASGTPVEGASVSVDRLDVPGVPDVGTSTGPDGRYDIRQLAAGTYRLTVVPPSGSGLSTTYWPGVVDEAAAAPIALRAGEDREQLDVTLPGGQGLAGRVVLPAGVDPAEVRVAVHRRDPGGWYTTVGGTTPAADRTYRFADLPPGTYLVHVEHVDWNGPLLPEYYRDALVEERARPVEVTAGAVVTGIDLTPVLAGHLTGVVTGARGPVAGVEVTVVPRSGQPVTWGFATTGGNGSFVIGRLPAGTYSVRLTLPDGSVQYYRAPGGTTRDLHGATRLRVREGETVDASARLRGGTRP